MVLGESHPFGVGLTAGGQKVRFITANVIEGVMHPCSNANHASLGNFSSSGLILDEIGGTACKVILHRITIA